MEKLELFANIAAILTFLGGAGAWCYYQYGFRHKKKELENYLKEKFKGKSSGGDYQFSFLHLTKELGLTESEILKASFCNRRIKRVTKPDKECFADKILFQYNDTNSN